jgi:hypothetical protein
VATNFYLAMAPTCFTLLGLWLIIVQTRHAEWRESSPHRRRAYAISLHFSLPGLMSLLSLVDADSATLWRVSFAVIASVGALSIVALGRWGRSDRDPILVAAAFWIGLVLYVLIAIEAARPSLLSSWVTTQPLRVEAMLLSGLVFLGVNVAWLLLFDEDPRAAPRSG